MSCFSSKIDMDLASEQDLCCTHLRGLLRIRMTETLVQGQPLGLAGRQFDADAQLEVLILAEQFTFMLSHTGVCSILACPALLG